MQWIMLLLAGVFEVTWACAMKYSEGFTRLMPSVYGCGIAEKIRSLQMEKAKSLLVDHKELLLSEVTMQCGFHNYNYFITVFFREVGFSPYVWKKHV